MRIARPRCYEIRIKGGIAFVPGDELNDSVAEGIEATIFG